MKTTIQNAKIKQTPKTRKMLSNQWKNHSRKVVITSLA